MKKSIAHLLPALALAVSAWLPAAAVASDLKDPTRPPAPIAAAKQHAEHVSLPVVSAIFISGSRRVAVFNDQPVHEGDSVGAYRIETITATGVHYRSAGQLAFAALATAGG
jgi:hypothetical protein